MRNRKEFNKREKNFSLSTNNLQADNSTSTIDFSKIKVGLKTLEDATLNVGPYRKLNPKFGDKAAVLDSISKMDLDRMRDISNYYYRVSGIYSRLCRYMAYMYKYDWYVTPYVNSENLKKDKILEGFNKILTYLDNFEVKKFFGEVALKVMKNGCYYGYIIQLPNRAVIQELPPKYCRSRFMTSKGRPAVEFNMKFFDESFHDTTQKIKVLNLFPDEIKKGYILYKDGKLPKDFVGDDSGWYLLNTDSAIKFNINGDDHPPLISVIPAILDLDAAQDLDFKKLQQQLLKIIVQTIPTDKNGDFMFDVDEAQTIHNNAIRMLGKAIGIDVLTTYANTQVADLADSTAASTTDDGMDRIKQSIYDQAGISQMQFNTDGNIALEKSILNDEASMYNLIQQFESFLNFLVESFNRNPKKIYYKVQILNTTIYNYKDLAKLFKENVQLGYSKMLPQVALGQSQSSILANAHFENEVLDLVTLFVPPMSSNTMNADSLTQLKGGSSSSQSESGTSSGRPTNESKGEPVTEKTISNKETQS